MSDRVRFVVVLSLIAVFLYASPALAQTAPPATLSQPDDTPNVHVGTTLFTDFTYVASPEQVDAGGTPYHYSSFNVTRSYINVIGNLSHLVGFRVTPDITRETAPGSALNGALVFRIKYAYGQLSLDDWLPRTSWVRLGIQQTPWVEFEESIYRYRFQGTTFTEREGFLSSADAGASFHYGLPSDYGDVHVGVYNGENYNHVETNGQKALEVRGSVRPFATSTSALHGLRVHGFVDADSYVPSAPRRRVVLSTTFEHRRLNLGVDYLDTADQLNEAAVDVRARGYSVWVTPRFGAGVEGLIRYDHMTPDISVAGWRTRSIVGVAYWFPHQGSVSSAILLDYDGQTFHDMDPAQPQQQRIALHGLVAF